MGQPGSGIGPGRKNVEPGAEGVLIRVLKEQSPGTRTRPGRISVDPGDSLLSKLRISLKMILRLPK
jgi:hypothetical protein